MGRYDRIMGIYMGLSVYLNSEIDSFDLDTYLPPHLGGSISVGPMYYCPEYLNRTNASYLTSSPMLIRAYRISSAHQTYPTLWSYRVRMHCIV